MDMIQLEKYSWNMNTWSRIWVTFIPDTNPSCNPPPHSTIHPQGFPDTHRLSEGGWNTVSGSQALGPLQQNWTPLGGQEGETHEQKRPIKSIFSVFLFKNPWTLLYTRNFVQPSLPTESFPKLYFPNASSTLHHPTIPQPPQHTPPDPAWQVPLDDKFQGSRLENRLTTKDPNRFWPGKMGSWLEGSGGCYKRLRYILYIMKYFASFWT